MNNQIDLSKSVIFPIGKKEGGSNEWLKPVDNEHYGALD